MSRQMFLNTFCFICIIFCWLWSSTLPGQSAERIPIVFDTDIGTDIDDAFALGLIFASEELELRGITTVGGDTKERAMMVCRFLSMSGRRHTRVAAGADPQPVRPIASQHQYYYHPDVLFDRTKKSEAQTAVEFLQARLKQQPAKTMLIAAGPLTNIARLIGEHPDTKSSIQRIIVLEANIKLDIDSAKSVFASGIPLVLVPETVCDGLKLDDAQVEKIFSPGSALTRQVQTLYQLWDQHEPPLADVLAVVLAFNESFAEYSDHAIIIDDQGKLQDAKGEPNVRMVAKLKQKAFVDWYVNRIASLVPPERNPVQLIERGGMPERVHVAEDYDSDIERRWWMSGKAETKLLPAASRRACRGVLTHDFDDLLMNSRQMYTAVIFNPVPGPPMGKRTRLSFRYWLKGTDTIRVQIYSLTNGYHRQLVVKGLQQETWQDATVDMTLARRPDGTGGPLSENERIDDIQFYVDANAEVIIDDIVLYEAAADGEKRPFPQRIIFCGWFDTGQQGKEWPGSFEIVPEQGYFWRAARSVENADEGAPWIRLNLRGQRSLGDKPQLTFRYRLKAADNMRVKLVNSDTNKHVIAELTGLESNTWKQTTIDFKERLTGSGATLETVDEIHFLLPKQAELFLDDVLLFEPGE